VHQPHYPANTAATRASLTSALPDWASFQQPLSAIAGGLDQYGIELVATLAQFRKNADEITAHAAADAPIVQLENFLVGLNDQLMVHSDFAEFIFDDRDAFAVIFGEDAIQERSFARAEKAGDNGDGDGRFGVHEEMEVGAAVYAARNKILTCAK